VFYIRTLAILQLCPLSCGCHAECYVSNNIGMANLNSLVTV